jgi:hypothetical protein
MTCDKCNGTGQIRTSVMQGAYLIAPCDCEHAERARQEFEQEMIEFRRRLREAKERLKMEVCC